MTLTTTSNALRRKLVRPVVWAMTLGLTFCGIGCCGPRASQFQEHQILRLSAGEVHRAETNEVWHSAARYAALEQELINCAAALKQKDNK